MVVFTLISLSMISLCIIYFLSMVCIQLNRIMSINLLLGMDVTKLYSDDDFNDNKDYIDSLINNSAMFLYKTVDKIKKHI
ncbi:MULTISPECIES: hypothetical protein [unclassified Romboutsia]|uniref:hypothetical protein n=1 Tax=unclassified Romboutsia TaxID=2626894 RepID=UPI0008211D6D|nr:MULTISPECIES: hypothetical protein [unclassified Romboutsia]SCH76705.1 Uncharacterised protein [uncultured Clostridium sp.]